MAKIMSEVPQAPPSDVGRSVNQAGETVARPRDPFRIHAHDAPGQFFAVEIVVKGIFWSSREIDCQRIVEAKLQTLPAQGTQRVTQRFRDVRYFVHQIIPEETE